MRERESVSCIATILDKKGGQVGGNFNEATGIAAGTEERVELVEDVVEDVAEVDEDDAGGAWGTCSEGEAVRYREVTGSLIQSLALYKQK